MNAQQRWKESYNFSRKAVCEGRNGLAEEYMIYARRYRREAALERRIAALERENARLHKAANNFSKAHSTGCPRCDNPSADPQDLYEFDVVFGIAQ